jgi:hypothetical protein
MRYSTNFICASTLAIALSPGHAASSATTKGGLCNIYIHPIHGRRIAETLSYPLGVWCSRGQTTVGATAILPRTSAPSFATQMERNSCRPNGPYEDFSHEAQSWDHARHVMAYVK